MRLKKRRHRRKKSYARRRKNRVFMGNKPRRKRSYRRKRRYSPRSHRKRHYRRRRHSTNPKRRRSYARKRHHRRGRRRNPSTVARAYRTSRSLFSVPMAKNVAVGAVGYAGVNLIAPFIPWAPSGSLGFLFRKGLAAVATYLVGGMVFRKASYKKYLLYGAALNIGFDVIQQYFPGIASKAKLSGYSGYGDFTSPTPEVMRMIPTASIPIGI
jgi:hypothetical protein